MEVPLTVGPPSTATVAVLFTLTVTMAFAVMPLTWVVAVTVACVAAVTCGAVNPPEAETTPIVLLQFTVVVGAPLAKALHWLFCRDWMMVGVQLTVIAETGVTVTVALAFLVESWIEVAVIVTMVATVTACAVNTPLASMLPALAPQETAVLKLVPVPVTVAVHWLVWPDTTVAGLQVMVTAVMAVLLEPLPPQAAIPKRANNARIRTRTRKPSPRSYENAIPYCK